MRLFEIIEKMAETFTHPDPVYCRQCGKIIGYTDHVFMPLTDGAKFVVPPMTCNQCAAGGTTPPAQSPGGSNEI